ncbi:MAG: D-glycero-beta-D-manno-heptose 1,7-bisphosphate 7-phosphatase [Candidatus Thiodiazotropha sp. (ex Monitilora ramsayi)]|nr:D-glycero-beta-D-manno-heptose 1,7-bisphosphate 7-phosphatase [Candidatus Thiodiazotropha sp. (ex Monitilora ramsayi)]
MKLVILDRDGVINQDSDNFIKSPDEWIPIEGSLNAITRLNHAGYKVYVATNQSGLARRLFNIETLHAIHNKMMQAVKSMGGTIEAILFCPHGPLDDCDCRKPKPGLYLEIGKRSSDSLRGVPVIGDSFRDLEAALDVGARPILVRTGKGKKTIREQRELLQDIEIYQDLADAVDHLLSEASNEE